MFFFFSAICIFTGLDVFFFLFSFSLKTLVCPNDFGLIFYRLNDPTLSRFKGNTFLMLPSGSHKVLTILTEFIVFYDKSFLALFFFSSFLFHLIGFGLYIIGLSYNASFDERKKCVARVCVLKVKRN